MKKIISPLLLSVCTLAGCQNSSTSSSTSSVTSKVPPEITPLTIDVLDNEKCIPYGSTLNEIEYNVVLTYSDGSKKILTKNDYTLTYEKNATFLVGEGKAVLTYNENESIKNEVKYIVTPRKHVSLLFIGNSFSDDTIEYMYNIATSLGVGLSINNLFVGSCTLDVHFNNLKNDNPAYEYRSWNGTSWVTTYNYKISTALKQEVWDFVSLQQGSGSSGIYSTYSHLEDCIELIKANLIDEAHTQFIWNMTWAYQQDSTHGEFANYHNNQIEMYEAIVSCAQKLNRDVFKVIIPSGTAIQNARTSIVGDTLTRDGFHLNVGMGRYIASLNAIKAITGIDFGEVPYSPSLSAEQKAICFESVANAWLKPYEITNSKYEPEKPETQEELAKLTEDMNKLKITFKRGYYYYCIDPQNVSKPLGPRSDFICTNILTKGDIPNGSIIRIASGYKYRPDGWVNLESYWTGERPDNVLTEYVKVDDNWWGSFNYRGFNISNINGTSLEDCYEEAEASFSIFVPKK